MDFKKDEPTTVPTSKPESKPSKKMISLRLTSEILNHLDSITELYGISQSKAVSMLIYSYATNMDKTELDKHFMFHKGIS